MFLEIVAAVAVVVVAAGLVVEWLSGRGVTLPAALDPPGASVVTRLGRLADDHPAFVVLTSGVAAVLFMYPFVDATMRAAGTAPPFGYWDFGAYTSALYRWLEGEAMYVTNDQGGYFGTYLYPPFFVLFVWPFYELFSFETGAMLWQVSSVLFLWLSLQPVSRALGHRLHLWERGLLLWLLVGYHPVLFSVKQGQISAFLAGLLSLALYGLLRGEGTGGRIARYGSGVATALVGTVKLVYAAVGAHLLADRDRFAAAAVAGLAVVAVSFAVFGVDAHLGYLDVLRWGKGGDPRTPLLWMRAYYVPFYAIADISLPIRVLASIGIGALALGAAAADVDREIFAMGVGAMPIIAPHAYNYYLAALLPAVLVLVVSEVERDGRPLLPVAALFLLQFHSYGLKVVVEQVPSLLPAPHALVPLLDVTVASAVVSVLQPGVWGALLLTGLATARVARAARVPPWLEAHLG